MKGKKRRKEKKKKFTIFITSLENYTVYLGPHSDVVGKGERKFVGSAVLHFLVSRVEA